MENTRFDQSGHQFSVLSDAIDSGRHGAIQRLLNTLAPAEIADLLESLPIAKRRVVWKLVDPDDDGDVLLEVGEEVRDSLLEDMDLAELVYAADSLEMDDLVELVEELPDKLTDELLRAMDREDRERLELVLAYPEESAGRLMNPDVATVRSEVTVDVVLRYLRLRGELPEGTHSLYVVNRRNQYVGRLSLARLLTQEPDQSINELLDEDAPAIHVSTDEKTIAQRFEDYDWASAAVVDDHNVLLGRITIDDVVDIIREQADRQTMGAAGLDEEEDLFASPFRAVRKRALWLGINLISAFVVASIIGQFQATLEKVVALAVLMPIVASMGGNAALQAMTLTIRGLATGHVQTRNFLPLLNKEFWVGMMNGLLWAFVVAVAAHLWFGDQTITTAIFGAMTIVLICAAVIGVGIPILLKRLHIDPAIAGSIVVTVATDAIGFAVFLGLGTVLLG